MELAVNKVPNIKIHERAAGRVILGLVIMIDIIRKLCSLILTKKTGDFVSNNATVIS